VTELTSFVDAYASEVDYAAHAEKFLTCTRWTGDNPVLLLADAAGTTTGQSYFTHVKPSVEAFQNEFIDTGRVDSLETLSALDQDDPELTHIFEATRKRRVLIEAAEVLANWTGHTDLDRLQTWAKQADPYAISTDPIGQIRGVGLRTFQFLRMIAGVDTVKPDIQVQRFVTAIADATDRPQLDASNDMAVLESCERIAAQTGYRMIELDQIAWWHFSKN
jgi:hypothetical protein